MPQLIIVLITANFNTGFRCAGTVLIFYIYLFTDSSEQSYSVSTTNNPILQIRKLKQKVTF